MGNVGAQSRILLLSLAALAIADRSPTQSDWAERSASGGPSAREEHAMATDEARGAVVLFGGRGADGVLRGDTWTWDGTSWLSFGTGGPPARRGAAFAYHAGTRRLVLFGGYDAQGAPLGDTWGWNGASWSRSATAVAPRARAGAALALAPDTGALVLFGGVDRFGTALGDTWLWDGAAWREAVPAVAPPARFGHRMATDGPRREVVMFGGVGALPVTWTWSGGTWAARLSLLDPGPRQRHAMAFDPRRGRVVLHGGTDGAAYALADTWEWDGVAWIPRATTVAPAPRVDATLGFEPGSGRCTLFGGFDGVAARADTWDYGPVFPARAVGYGAGCAGSAGTPRIGAGGALPWLGDALRVQVTGIPAAGPVQVTAGFSRVRWGAFALPFDLGVVGMPGCSVLASIDATAGVPNLGGRAELTFQLPVDASLRGGHVYLQAILVDPGANALGATMSDALALTLGAR